LNRQAGSALDYLERAKAPGLSISSILLARADEAIE
jgi:hypothetical protein